MLIIAHAIQGVGGGMAQPLGPALLYRAFPPKEQGTTLGYFGIALVVAPAFEPNFGRLSDRFESVAGHLLYQYTDWHYWHHLGL